MEEEMRKIFFFLFSSISSFFLKIEDLKFLGFLLFYSFPSTPENIEFSLWNLVHKLFLAVEEIICWS